MPVKIEWRRYPRYRPAPAPDVEALVRNLVRAQGRIVAAKVAVWLQEPDESSRVPRSAIEAAVEALETRQEIMRDGDWLVWVGVPVAG